MWRHGRQSVQGLRPMLFIKYISDKYAKSDDFAPPVTIPKGASFDDMVALKGKSDIGDKINIGAGAPERSPGWRHVFL